MVRKKFVCKYRKYYEAKKYEEHLRKKRKNKKG